MKKKMGKLWALLLVATLTFTGACTSKKENVKPVITGVQDLLVEAGNELNVLENVKASDEEDGDLTSKIKIEAMPSLDIKNGKVTVETAGNYELTYSVTDKNGEVAEAYATLTVTKKTGEEVVYQQYDFDTVHTVDNRGWVARVADGVNATGELKQGAYVFDIVSPGNGDGDIQLVKSGFALKAADYKIKVWAKATKNTYAHLIARDEKAEGWATYGGVFNAVITPDVAPIELNFTSNGEGSVEFLFNLGKITPNGENPADTTPENFTVTIDKIELYVISGAETLVPVVSYDFAKAEQNLSVSAGDGAVADATTENEKGKINVTSYPTSGGVWSIKADVALGGLAIEEGQKYYYSFKLSGANAQSGECLVESATSYDANRVHFNSFLVNGGEEVVVSGVFTADRPVADPVIRLQIGNPSEGVTSNQLFIDDVVFGKVEGDKEVVKTIDAFRAFGKETANATNPAFPWDTFNATDEDKEKGVGTIWTENGSLFYRIDQAGVTDWYNKLIGGCNDNPLVLKSDSYYTIEITAKASKDVSCGVFLNPLGSWDPKISEQMNLTTENQTFRFVTTDTLVMDMNFELLFQFGSEQTAQLGEVVIDFSDITIYQKSVN